MRPFVSLCVLISTVTACDSDARQSTVANSSAAVAAVGARIDEKIEGGMHRRVTTAHGPVHLWTPRHYSEGGDIVVYVHGNDIDVDDAWTEHALAQQFAASGRDAMFIVPEAPSSESEAVNWASLSELLGTVQKTNGLELPKGRVIVVGHSAAHRTIVPWLAESQVDGLVLIDAVYGNVERYREWLGERKARQLIFVGGEATRAWTEQLHGLLPQATVVEGVPALGQARPTKIVYVRSAAKHYDLVTSGTVLPVLLQMSAEEPGTPVAGM